MKKIFAIVLTLALILSCGAFAEGTIKIAVAGRSQTGSYTNREGQKVYTTDVIVEEQEFAESRKTQKEQEGAEDDNGFMNIPEGMDDDIPFR